MNWRFWEVVKKQDERLSPAIINEQLANMLGRLENLEAYLKDSQQQVYNIDGQLAQNADQLTETTTQLQKLARLHYKTGQETQGKLDKLITGMDEIQHWQGQYLENNNQLQLKDQQVALLTEAVIRQLDDLDYICQALKEDASNNWQQMFEQWAAQLVQALAKAGILEIDLYGKSFDPRLAEAIATVTREEALKMCPDTGTEALLPYQVVKITRRGFITPQGRLLRKAQVITVRKKEESNSV